MTFQRAEAPPVADAGPPPAAESASSEAVDAAEVSMFSVRLQAGAETDGAGESDAAEELAAAEEGAVHPLPTTSDKMGSAHPTFHRAITQRRRLRCGRPLAARLQTTGIDD